MIKKTLIITSLLFVVVGMSTSCKKDWTCQCEPTENSAELVKHFPIDKQTKKDAQNLCKKNNTTELDCNLR